MERKVDFVACDMPSANAFMINVYAAVAQEERRMISDRAKAGLAAAKARGVKLGVVTARNQRNAPGGRPRASTGHCANSLGTDRQVGPSRGCAVECAPGRKAKRCTVVCQDRHPCARAAEIDCALGAGPRGRTLPDNTPPSGLPRAEICRGGGRWSHAFRSIRCVGELEIVGPQIAIIRQLSVEGAATFEPHGGISCSCPLIAKIRAVGP